jgi:hypothetical protein
LNALVFLYRDVLDQSIGGGIAPIRSKRHPKIPVVMTQDEVQLKNGGHADVKTTEIYTHVMEKDITALTSPLDQLPRTF